MKPRFPPRRILVGVDLSEPSMAALETAKALCVAFDARLHVEFVEPPPIAQVPDDLGATAARLYEQSAADFRKRWQHAVSAAVSDLATPAKLSIERGIPESSLARRATARSADLVVLGTQGKRGAERLFLGSVAESVVHRARVPVLTVRVGKSRLPTNILAPCHMERYADEALFYALRFAEALKATVTVLYVPPSKDWELDAELKVRMHLEECFGTHAARALKIVVRKGEARSEILAEVSTGRYDLVALSAHRRSKLSDLALGTTAERLVRRGELPVLAVPAPARRSLVSRAKKALQPALHPPIL